MADLTREEKIIDLMEKIKNWNEEINTIWEGKEDEIAQTEKRNLQELITRATREMEELKETKEEKIENPENLLKNMRLEKEEKTVKLNTLNLHIERLEKEQKEYADKLDYESKEIFQEYAKSIENTKNEILELSKEEDREEKDRKIRVLTKGRMEQEEEIDSINKDIRNLRNEILNIEYDTKDAMIDKTLENGEVVKMPKVMALNQEIEKLEDKLKIATEKKDEYQKYIDELKGINKVNENEKEPEEKNEVEKQTKETVNNEKSETAKTAEEQTAGGNAQSNNEQIENKNLEQNGNTESPEKTSQTQGVNKDPKQEGKNEQEENNEQEKSGKVDEKEVMSMKIGRSAVIKIGDKTIKIPKKLIKEGVELGSSEQEEFDDSMERLSDKLDRDVGNQDWIQSLYNTRKNDNEFSSIYSIVKAKGLSNEEKESLIKAFKDHTLDITYDYTDLSKTSIISRIIGREINEEDKLRMFVQADRGYRRGANKKEGELKWNWKAKLINRFTANGIELPKSPQEMADGLFEKKIEDSYDVAKVYNDNRYAEDGTKLKKAEFMDRLKANSQDYEHFSHEQKQELKSLSANQLSNEKKAEEEHDEH